MDILSANQYTFKMQNWLTPTSCNTSYEWNTESSNLCSSCRVDLQESYKSLQVSLYSKRENEDEGTHKISTSRFENHDRPYPMKLTSSGNNPSPEFKMQDFSTSHKEDSERNIGNWSICSPCKLNYKELSKSPGYDACVPLIKPLNFNYDKEDEERHGGNIGRRGDDERPRLDKRRQADAGRQDASTANTNDLAMLKKTRISLVGEYGDVDEANLNPSKRRKMDFLNNSSDIGEINSGNVGKGSNFPFMDNARGGNVATKDSCMPVREYRPREYNDENRINGLRRITENAPTSTLGCEIDAETRLFGDKRVLLEIKCDRHRRDGNSKENILLKTELQIGDARTIREARFFENISARYSGHETHATAVRTSMLMLNKNVPEVKNSFLRPNVILDLSNEPSAVPNSILQLKKNVGLFEKTLVDSKFPRTLSVRQCEVPSSTLKPQEHATNVNKISTNPKLTHTYLSQRSGLTNSILNLKENAGNVDNISTNTKLTHSSLPRYRIQSFISNLSTQSAKGTVCRESSHDAMPKGGNPLVKSELFGNHGSKCKKYQINLPNAVLSRHSNPIPKRLIDPMYIRNSLGTYDDENLDEETLLEGMLNRCKDVPHMFYPQKNSKTLNATTISYARKQNAAGSRDKIIRLRKSVLRIANRLSEITSNSEHVSVPSIATLKSTLAVCNDRGRNQTPLHIPRTVETPTHVQDGPMYTYNPFQVDSSNRVKRSSYK